ncbi:Na+/H+ antiporter [Rhizobium leguminosarum]|uniref:Na+/H+ antiporter n=1 Tax=Rhizobium leguminosarum TaxID=384 RepID=UPI001C92A675|nr:Na+/H+ antiporter [Rhizobium leguminosarum]MBY2919718.1 Na+/H+ antiporter [Rhizobium leguminosarum]MBY2975412.1 Na+/H+ antiporter [Rhizobium leguminosarum]MBY2977654.1 Na+/H+ antiporter [Rhizobium leguminosarum]MBY3006204.1 Na+/H+ antiporter [Rhizobium leguminosarum]
MNRSEIFLVFAIIAAVAIVGALAKRFNISGAIAFVIAGVVIGLIPLVPVVHIEPELVLMLLLPPLLYSAGVGMSWRGLKSSIGTISFLAIGGVIFTALGVAAVLNTVFGIDWLVGLLLGAIIAPPDAVAPMAIVKRYVLPDRLVTIIEGEGLVNDATALILIGFTIATIQGGDFSFITAVGRFLLIVVGEIAWGMIVGRLLLELRKLAQDPHVEIVLSLMTPFVAFWVPQAVGGSGVLAAVSAGVYVSWNGPRYIASATRLQGFFTWDLVTYVIQGVAFFLTGLQVRAIVASSDMGVWTQYLTVALAAGLVMIVLRFAWVFTGTFLSKLAAKKLGFDAPARWKYAAVISVTGVRGVVSLLAALAIPDVKDAAGVDSKSMILVVTLCVIIASMIGVDATLPWIVRRLGLANEGAAEAKEKRSQEIQARLDAVAGVLEELDRLDEADWTPESLAELKRKHQDRHVLYQRIQHNRDEGNAASDYPEIQLRLIEVERLQIAKLYAEQRLDDDARRRIERELDLEDTRLRHIIQGST